MKVIILAGGFGTRLSEFTSVIPKPMVTIGGRPILLHIMQRYAFFGHKDFYLALGYKAEVIKKFFLNYNSSWRKCRYDHSIPTTSYCIFLEPTNLYFHNLC